MDAVDKKNAGLAALFALLALVCGGLLSSYFLWELVDTENHLWAQLTFLASVLMYLVGGFSLDAFVTVLRFGFVREKKGIVNTVCAIVHALLRSLLTFCNAGLLFLSAVSVWESRGAMEEWVGALLFLAAVLAGYAFLFQLEKRIKAQRALRVTFD